MNTHLNESHVCLMNNWSTFRKMKASEDEVGEYIRGIAKSVVSNMVHEHGSLFESDMSQLEKQQWISITPASLINFKKKNIDLISFGIEGIKLDMIFQPDSASLFQAYVYSPWSQSEHPAIYSALETLLRSISGPNEFILDVNKPYAGYWYTKKLSTLPADKLLDDKFLTETFREPFVSVIEWYNKNSKQILTIEPK